MPKRKKTSRSYVIIPLVVLLVLLLNMTKMTSNLALVDRSPIDSVSTDDWKASIEEYANNYMGRRGVPGLQVAIVTDTDSIEYFNSGSSRNWSTIPITTNTVFEAASLTKPLTAWAILDMADRGLVDLDSVIYDSTRNYTPRQLLSHTAGFNNNLTGPVAPASSSGDFSYAGQGYIKLAEIISLTSGLSYQDYMNKNVLPQLGMFNSHMGNNNSRLTEADPHISVSMVLLVGVFLYLVIYVSISILVRIWFWLRKRVMNHATQRLNCYFSIILTFILITVSMGLSNGFRIVLANGALVVLIIGVLKGLKEWNAQQFRSSDNHEGYAWATLGVLAMVALAYVLMSNDPIPLKKREAKYLGPSGLYTTAGDYAQFIRHLIHSDKGKRILAAMTDELVAVNEHNDWGLGVGVQKGENPAIWHWGVNYPGFQSFFICWPNKGKGIVILMNGGPLNFSPGGIRYSGLEFAREIVIKTFGGTHYSYWQGVQ